VRFSTTSVSKIPEVIIPQGDDVSFSLLRCKMGGDANMFRTSNVLREAELPDKPEVWPVLDMLSRSPI
jgi:hypothetical protein